jgi:cullin 3
LIAAKEVVNEEPSDAVPSSVEEERRLILDAAIVRIMKARKTLSHNPLLEEVTRQVSNRFNPQPAAVKSRIESLIEREYLKRDENDQRKYIYMA